MKAKRKKCLLSGKKGQHIIEYAIVAGIVAAAVVAMSTYVYRSIQAKSKDINNEFTYYK